MKTSSVAALLLAVSSAPLQAQQQDDPARLDDFAVPTGEQPLGLEQVTLGDPTAMPEQNRDRSLARSARKEPAGVMPTQLSGQSDGGEVAQLATPNESRGALSAAVAKPGDRLPGGVQRIGGADRCDPQLDQKVYAECLRILELRAAEFSAPQAPVLSPEQRLLSEVRQPAEMAMAASAELRARLATTTDANADLQSNQELAAIYFRADEPPVQIEAAAAEKDSSLAALLQNLGLETSVPPGGN